MEKNEKSQKLDGFLIEQKELERLLTARDLDFREVCNLISLIEKNYEKCFRSQIIPFLQYKLKMLMSGMSE